LHQIVRSSTRWPPLLALTWTTSRFGTASTWTRAGRSPLSVTCSHSRAVWLQGDREGVHTGRPRSLLPRAGHLVADANSACGVHGVDFEEEDLDRAIDRASLRSLGQTPASSLAALSETYATTLGSSTMHGAVRRHRPPRGLRRVAMRNWSGSRSDGAVSRLTTMIERGQAIDWGWRRQLAGVSVVHPLTHADLDPPAASPRPVMTPEPHPEKVLPDSPSGHPRAGERYLPVPNALRSRAIARPLRSSFPLAERRAARRRRLDQRH